MGTHGFKQTPCLCSVRGGRRIARRKMPGESAMEQSLIVGPGYFSRSENPTLPCPPCSVGLSLDQKQSPAMECVGHRAGGIHQVKSRQARDEMGQADSTHRAR